MTQILLDADGILFDLVTPWLHAINARTGCKVRLADIRVFDIKQAYPVEHHAEVKRTLLEPGRFRSLTPFAGAVPAVKWLNRNYGVKVVTAPAGPLSAMEKMEALEEHFPFLAQRQIVLCHEKWEHRGDLLVDDKGETRRRYREAWPTAVTATFDWPWSEPDSYDDIVVPMPDLTSDGAEWRALTNNIARHFAAEP